MFVCLWLACRLWPEQFLMLQLSVLACVAELCQTLYCIGDAWCISSHLQARILLAYFLVGVGGQLCLCNIQNLDISFPGLDLAGRPPSEVLGFLQQPQLIVDRPDSGGNGENI